MSEFHSNSFKWAKFPFDRHNFPTCRPSVVQNCEHEGE